jgi:hypothetical protein
MEANWPNEPIRRKQPWAENEDEQHSEPRPMRSWNKCLSPVRMRRIQSASNSGLGAANLNLGGGKTQSLAAIEGKASLLSSIP